MESKIKNERGALHILAAVLLVAIVGVVGLAIYNASNRNPQSKTPSPTPTTTASPVATTKTYANSELGLTFKYPAAYGEVTLTKETSKYTGGNRFSGQFSNNTKIKFLVSSTTYRDEGLFLLNTFRGHYEAGGKTYYRWADDQYTSASPVQISAPLKTLTVNGKKVLIINDASLVHLDGPSKGPGEGNIAGLANLNGTTYPGVVFITSLPSSELEQILNTLAL